MNISNLYKLHLGKVHINKKDGEENNFELDENYKDEDEDEDYKDEIASKKDEIKDDSVCVEIEGEMDECNLYCMETNNRNNILTKKNKSLKDLLEQIKLCKTKMSDERKKYMEYIDHIKVDNFTNNKKKELNRKKHISNYIEHPNENYINKINDILESLSILGLHDCVFKEIFGKKMYLLGALNGKFGKDIQKILKDLDDTFLYCQSNTFYTNPGGICYILNDLFNNLIHIIKFKQTHHGIIPYYDNSFKIDVSKFLAKECRRKYSNFGGYVPELRKYLAKKK
jgi:hypothetical protein